MDEEEVEPIVLWQVTPPLHWRCRSLRLAIINGGDSQEDLGMVPVVSDGGRCRYCMHYGKPCLLHAHHAR